MTKRGSFVQTLFICNAFSEPIVLTDVTEFNSTGTSPSGDLLFSGYTYVNKIENTQDWVSWTQNFDFDPPAEEILTATLTIYLRDDDDLVVDHGTKTEYARAYLYANHGYNERWDLDEEINNGSYYSHELNVSYLASGSVSFLLASTEGDFFIDWARININYNSVPVLESIPEPITMLLLGAGLTGLAGFRRKFRNK